jgi:hypothetical protein
MRLPHRNCTTVWKSAGAMVWSVAILPMGLISSPDNVSVCPTHCDTWGIAHLLQQHTNTLRREALFVSRANDNLRDGEEWLAAPHPTRDVEWEIPG